MGQSSLRNNSLLTALLGTVATGLGYLYLRRWLRALGWLGLTVAASVLFVPESTISEISTGTLTNPLSILPIILVSAVCALDAYLIAKAKVQIGGVQATSNTGRTGGDKSLSCPACGKPVDSDLRFCHWCTTEFEFAHVNKFQKLDEAYLNRQ